MYTRFTVNYINKQSGINQGILGAAFKLSKEGRIPSSLKEAFDLHLTWFQKSLLTPNIFEDSKSLMYRNFKAQVEHLSSYSFAGFS
ncbi:hypothetical protein [Endozoicomonas sp.]|uniref:hypothetical protein n=1 Tax=Endozoicomonas sp. TaxID=1892382 RepID=UPI003D9ADB42